MSLDWQFDRAWVRLMADFATQRGVAMDGVAPPKIESHRYRLRLKATSSGPGANGSFSRS